MKKERLITLSILVGIAFLLSVIEIVLDIESDFIGLATVMLIVYMFLDKD
ncbi:unnamed protein product [marine sediment metagenome]|uniref:Uncharacterized protein n=1 Tax=marine sediment metagenome TaxID=412755 RepID=X1AML7_9ZZZZ